MFKRMTIDMHLHPQFLTESINMMKYIRESDEIIGSIELRNVSIYLLDTPDKLDYVKVMVDKDISGYPCRLYQDYPLHISRIEGTFNILNSSKTPKIILVDYEHRD